jgi:hypothetical protein
VLTDDEFTIDRAYVARVLAETSQINAEMFRLARSISIPPDDLMINRMAIGVLAVIGQLGVTRNWHRMALEFWTGEPPATELGRQDHEFFRGRGLKPLLQR